MMLLAPFALVSCLTLPAGAESVTAGDLHFEGVPPERVVAAAPEPGNTRILSVFDLRQLAAAIGLSPVPEQEICVKRAMEPLDSDRLLAAMQKEMPDATIKILSFSKQFVPLGEMSFRSAGIRDISPPLATWYGSIRYAPNRDFTIWARVALTVKSTRVVATCDLTPGRPIDNSQVKLETSDRFPSSQPLVQTLGEALAHYPKALIRAGSEIHPNALEPPADVRQGDVVEVEVSSGNAHLKLEARAAGSGCAGDRISILNPRTGKRFTGTIVAKDKISLDVMP